MITSKNFSYIIPLASFMIPSLLAMEKNSGGKPAIDFSFVTREGLNNFALEQDVRNLTPRSFDSLQNRCGELNVNRNSSDFISVAISQHYKLPVDIRAAIEFECAKDNVRKSLGSAPMPKHDNKRPTLDFSTKSRAELNDFAIEKHVDGVSNLTPRSYYSLLMRCEALKITPESDDVIAKTLHENAERLKRSRADADLRVVIAEVAQASMNQGELGSCLYVVVRDDSRSGTFNASMHIAAPGEVPARENDQASPIPAAPDELPFFPSDEEPVDDNQNDQNQPNGYLPAWAKCMIQ